MTESPRSTSLKQHHDAFQESKTTHEPTTLNTQKTIRYKNP